MFIEKIVTVLLFFLCNTYKSTFARKVFAYKITHSIAKVLSLTFQSC